MGFSRLDTMLLAAAAGTVALTALTGGAQARGGSSEIYEKTYTLDKPLHGYEGQSITNLECTYKRYPVRKCRWNGSSETCKIVKWELQQTCY